MCADADSVENHIYIIYLLYLKYNKVQLLINLDGNIIQEEYVNIGSKNMNLMKKLK